jgi:hypothetical protein
MSYTKPTIVVLSSASFAIQGGGQKGNLPGDASHPTEPQMSTGNSYDLDE